jgi:CheY-like chemotaxis protein
MSKRILVVEDQKDDRQIIRDMLAGTDYEITEAEDGEQALAAVVSPRARGSRTTLQVWCKIWSKRPAEQLMRRGPA